MFPKEYVYNKGGRPVIYEKTEIAKTFLPKEQWWRIVNFDLGNSDNIIDWTHEREWRCPGNFEFELSEATILMARGFNRFCTWDAKRKESILGQVKGLVVLSDVLF